MTIVVPLADVLLVGGVLTAILVGWWLVLRALDRWSRLP